MTEFQTKDEAKLRRALRTLDDQAPISPSLADLKAAANRERTGRLRPAWVAVATFALTITAVVPVVLLSNSGEPDNVGVSTPVAPTTTAPTTTTAPQSTLERIPLSGRPEDLGVETVEYLAVMFPTTPQELRQFAVWNTVKTNVGLHRQEVCMTAKGHTVEMPRYLAVDFRRYAVMPDFELDAQYGVITAETIEYPTPGPLPGLTGDELSSWQTAYSECVSWWEERASTGFDQLVGPIGWFATIEEVNTSAGMRDATDQLLTCVAEGGGPEVDSVNDLYSDRITQQAGSLDEARLEWESLARLIADCAGDYHDVRHQLLVPIRDQLVNEHAETLAEAESFFNEIMAASGIAVP